MRVSPEIRALIEKHATENGLEPDLVEAVVLHESSGDPDACKVEPAFYERYTKPMNFSDTEEWLRATSWGLMQVMGQVARELGYKGKYFTTLCSNPELGIELGCRHLANKINRYGQVDWGLAAYNAGSARKDITGNLVNQVYVDAVMKHYKEIKGKVAA